MQNRFIYFIVLLLTVVTVSCQLNKKDDSGEYNPNPDKTGYELAAAVVLQSDLHAQLLSDLDELIRVNFESFTTERDNQSKQLTVDKSGTQVFPKQLTLVYSKWLSFKGREYNGTIRCTLTGMPRTPGSILSASFENLSISGFIINGTRIETTLNKNPLNQPEFKIVSDAMQMQKADGDQFTCSLNRTYTWVEGDKTPQLYDDVYHLSGSSSGKTSGGNEYIEQIGFTVIESINCPWISAGIIYINQSGTETGVSFANNDKPACDQSAKMIIDGLNYLFMLPDGFININPER